MRIVYITLGIVFTLFLVVIVISNLNDTITLKLANIDSFKIASWLEITTISIITLVATSAFWLAYYEIFKKELGKNARTAEKASIIAEESSDKIKLLEAKIQTLEEALKKALISKK